MKLPNHAYYLFLPVTPKNRENKKKGSPWQPSPVSFFLAELDLRVAASIFPIPLSFLRCSAPHTTKMALVMRIKFPPTYPLIYKTLRIDSKLTTAGPYSSSPRRLMWLCKATLGSTFRKRGSGSIKTHPYHNMHSSRKWYDFTVR